MNAFAVLSTGRKIPLLGLGTWKSDPGKGLTAPHQQAVDSRGRRTPAEGPHSEAVVNLKTSIRDAQAEDRGPLWQLRPSSDTAENVSNHQAKQHLMSSSASVAEKPDQFFGRFEEGSAVTTIDPAPGTNNQALITQSADVKQAVIWALQAGYRHIDCAAIYGNEAEIGEALHETVGPGKAIRREDVFITSKLWNTKHHPEDVEPALLNTLKDLQLEYLDLYLIHWPYAFQRGDVPFPRKEDGSLLYDDVDYKLTWAAMEKLVEKGLVRSIGLSNFNSSQIDDVLSVASIKPTVLQVESHPYLAQVELLGHCRDRGLVMTAYSPLGSPDRAWKHPDEPVLLQEPVVLGLAEKYKKSPAQIVLRWQIQRGVVTIPKSVTESRIMENIQVFDFILEEEEMKTITALNRGWRYILPTIKVDGQSVPRDAGHPFYPFNEPF